MDGVLRRSEIGKSIAILQVERVICVLVDNQIGTRRGPVHPARILSRTFDQLGGAQGLIGERRDMHAGARRRRYVAGRGNDRGTGLMGVRGVGEAESKRQNGRPILNADRVRI